jgi:hypothetical protein
MFIERRRAQRIAKHLVAQYLVPGNQEHWDMTEIKNFSEVGLLVTTNQDLDLGAIIRFRIKLPINPFHWYDLDGKVITCEKNIPGPYPTTAISSYLVRIEIVNITQELKDVIHNYVAWFLSKGGPNQ